jgi:hypothetical protein
MSWRSAWVLVPIALAGCGKTGDPPAPTPESIAWYTRIDPACRAAKAEDKPLLFLYAARWDMVTKELEHETWPDPDVRRLLHQSFIALRVDRTDTYMGDPPFDETGQEAERAREKFRPDASKYGTVIVLEADCKTERDRFSFVEPREMARRLRAARDNRPIRNPPVPY